MTYHCYLIRCCVFMPHLPILDYRRNRRSNHLKNYLLFLESKISPNTIPRLFPRSEDLKFRPT